MGAKNIYGHDEWMLFFLFIIFFYAWMYANAMMDVCTQKVSLSASEIGPTKVCTLFGFDSLTA